MTDEQRQSSRSDDDLPAIAGRRLPCTLAEFEHRCRVYLDHEQRTPRPDNGLIAVLCDAVRCAREYEDAVQERRADSVVPSEQQQNEITVPKPEGVYFIATTSIQLCYPTPDMAMLAVESVKRQFERNTR